MQENPNLLERNVLFLDILAMMNVSAFSSVTELICYHGKQVLNLQRTDQQQLFDKLLDDGKKTSSSGAVPNVPSNSINQNPSHLIPNQSPMAPQNPSSNSNLGSLNSTKPSFLQKNKIFLIIAGIVFLLVILAIIGMIIKRSSRSSDREDEIFDGPIVE